MGADPSCTEVITGRTHAARFHSGQKIFVCVWREHGRRSLTAFCRTLRKFNLQASSAVFPDSQHDSIYEWSMYWFNRTAVAARRSESRTLTRESGSWSRLRFSPEPETLGLTCADCQKHHVFIKHSWNVVSRIHAGFWCCFLTCRDSGLKVRRLVDVWTRGLRSRLCRPSVVSCRLWYFVSSLVLLHLVTANKMKVTFKKLHVCASCSSSLLVSDGSHSFVLRFHQSWFCSWRFWSQ